MRRTDEECRLEERQQILSAQLEWVRHRNKLHAKSDQRKFQVKKRIQKKKDSIQKLNLKKKLQDTEADVSDSMDEEDLK
jgi:serine phosphatase RsbU (regulator of sigma subunit)